MKKFLPLLLLITALAILPVRATESGSLPASVSTSIGDIALPDESIIGTALESVVKDTELDEALKKDRMAELENAKATLQTARQTVTELASLKASLQGISAQIRTLASQLHKTELQYKDVPALDKLTVEKAEELVSSVQEQSVKAQNDFDGATARYNSLQTLSERAQTTISKNKQDITSIEQSWGADTDVKQLPVRIQALRLYAMNSQNQLLQLQLENHTELLDMANYEMRIASIKNDYFQKYLSAVQERQSELLAEDGNQTSDEELETLAAGNPALKSQLETNRQIQGYLNSYRQESAVIANEAHQVESALSTVKQLSDSVSSELAGLDKNLLLSRLLNRQQTQIPAVTLSKNLNELIPDLTIWLYDIRAGRDKLFDIEGYVDSLTAGDETLKNNRDALTTIIAERRQLLNELHQLMSSELTTAINLKLQYEEFSKLRSKTSALITENLFWLKSNQPLGSEFLSVLLPGLTYELSGFTAQLKSRDYWEATAHTFLTLGVPAVLLALLIYFATPHIRRINNRLASRLDRQNDSVLVTPMAIVLNLVMVLPVAIIWALVGAVAICLCLDTAGEQLSVISMLMLHIIMFVYLLQILKPNSLAQRHFAMDPDALYQDRKLLNAIWYSLIPILIVANIVETRAASIYYDMLGFTITILCAVAMVVVSLRWLKRQLHSSDELPALVWFISLAGLIAPLAIAIAVANGYYYTTIKLVNRFAYTCYTVLIYWIVANTVHRTVYVLQSRLLQRNLAADGDEAQRRESNLDFLKDSLGLEKLSAKAFKLINTALICITAVLIYLQWSDLAGALGYLRNVVLWSHSEVVGGQEVVTDTLTLADVLLALLIVAVTLLLNRNLPALLERMFLWRGNGAQHRSTSYTVKIIVSYAIIALGIVMAAGALGIKWENLQWLVAALSVGLGFGLQEIFANFVSGLIILFERQIRVGDIITLNGLSGTVNKIRIRSTTIISFENKEVMIPNREFITAALTNWSLSNTVTKLEFVVPVSYDSDYLRAKTILTNIVRRCRYAAKGMAPLVYISDLGDGGVTLTAEIYVAEIGKRKATTDYLCTVTMAEFEKNGIDIPYDKLDVNIHDLDKEQLINDIGRKEQPAG